MDMKLQCEHSCKRNMKKPLCRETFVTISKVLPFLRKYLEVFDLKKKIDKTNTSCIEVGEREKLKKTEDVII